MSAVETIGRYRLEGVIGRGATGVVYRAWDDFFGREVALKTYHSTLDPDAVGEIFAREIQACGKLHHPNVVVVFDGGFDRETPFLVMELVDGSTVDEWLAEHGRFSAREALELLLAVAGALEKAHELGIIHRDLKPANLLLPARGRPGDVKITDFGVAKLMSAEQATTQVLVGTPRYMSPEKIEGLASDARTDVFSLGALAYELFTGISPFAGETPTAALFNVLNQDPPPPSSIEPGLPPALDAVVARALAKDPGARTPDVVTFAAELQAAFATSVRAPLEAAAILHEQPVSSKRADRGRRGRVEAVDEVDEVDEVEADLRGLRDLAGAASPSGSARRPHAAPIAMTLIGLLVAVLGAIHWSGWRLGGHGGSDQPPGGRVVSGLLLPPPTDGPMPSPVVAPTATPAPIRRATAPANPPAPQPPAPQPSAPPPTRGRLLLPVPTIPPPTATPAPTHTPRPRPTSTQVPTATPEPSPTPAATPTAEVTPVPAGASIDVVSNPPRAYTFLDDQPKGKTPIRIHGIDPGTHVLRVEKAGHRPYERSIRVEEGGAYELQVTLAKIVNSLRVLSTPSGAEVLVNGERKGRTPVTLGKLPSGTYRVAVELPGGVVGERVVDVGGGRLVEVRFELGP